MQGKAQANFALVWRNVDLQVNSEESASAAIQNDTPESLEGKVTTQSQSWFMDAINTLQNRKNLNGATKACLYSCMYSEPLVGPRRTHGLKSCPSSVQE